MSATHTVAPARRARARSRSDGRSRVEAALRVGAIALVLVLTLFPLYWLVNTSLKRPIDQMAIPPSLFPPVVTLQNYAQFLATDRFLRFFVNSTIIAFSTAVLATLFGSMAGYALVDPRVRGRETLALGILTTRMLPPVVLAVPFFLLFRTYGILDTHVGLILAYLTFTLPLSIWMMRGFFLDIPSELEDAARMDGASRFTAYRRIMLPLAAPGLSATFIFCFLISWNEFLYALVLTRSDRVHTVPIAAYSLIGDQGVVNFGALSAAGVVASIPMIVAVFAAQRYLVQGLSFGAVKG
jgi:multiple sugar transport system permease protein